MASTFPAKRTGESPTAVLPCVLFLPLVFVFASRRPAVFFRGSETLRVLVSPRTLSIFLVWFLLGNGLLCAAQIRSRRYQAEQSEKTAVKTAYEAYLAAWKDKDYTALNRLLSDDYQAVNFQGIVGTKAREIATAREDRAYETLSADVMSVTVFGDSAVASGLIEAAWKDDQKTTHNLTLRFLAMLQKQKGDWKLVATESTHFNKVAQ